MLTESDLKRRVGPILSDGTPFRDLIDLDQREVSFRVMNDPEIHELELKKIFSKSWIAIAHEAEIPRPGDYVSRYLGEDNVLVIRDNNGDINILLNVCAHRGMEICRADHGNQLSFICPFHGWTYDANGRLLGAPVEKQVYGDWDKSAPGYGLVRARAETLPTGIIFGNFDPNAPSLDEYLGPIKWYLDGTLGDYQSDDVIINAEFVPRARTGGNWKLISDQFWGDNYHGITLHKSTRAIERVFGADDIAYPMAASVSSSLGHVMTTVESASTQEEVNEIVRSGGGARGVFPSSGLNGGVGGAKTGIAGLTMIVPKGPTDSELTTIMVIRKDYLAELFGREETPKTIGGPIQLVVADDSLQFSATQRAAQGYVARNTVTMKYNAASNHNDRPEVFPGPALSWDASQGSVHVNVQRDDLQWAWWIHYFDVMTTDS